MEHLSVWSSVQGVLFCSVSPAPPRSLLSRPFSHSPRAQTLNLFVRGGRRAKSPSTSLQLS